MSEPVRLVDNGLTTSESNALDTQFGRHLLEGVALAEYVGIRVDAGVGPGGWFMCIKEEYYDSPVADPVLPVSHDPGTHSTPDQRPHYIDMVLDAR